MTFPEWTKPALYAALGGAIFATILGFTLAGWMTNGAAQTMAQDVAAEDVIMALVPVCLDRSATDPERVAKLAALQELSGFARRNAMMETGWVTPPGSESPSRDLATACLTELELEGS